MRVFASLILRGGITQIIFNAYECGFSESSYRFGLTIPQCTNSASNEQSISELHTIEKLPEDLTEMSLIRYGKDIKIFRTTEKDLRFLNAYYRIDDAMKIKYRLEDNKSIGRKEGDFASKDLVPYAMIFFFFFYFLPEVSKIKFVFSHQNFQIRLRLTFGSIKAYFAPFAPIRTGLYLPILVFFHCFFVFFFIVVTNVRMHNRTIGYIPSID